MPAIVEQNALGPPTSTSVAGCGSPRFTVHNPSHSMRQRARFYAGVFLALLPTIAPAAPSPGHAQPEPACPERGFVDRPQRIDTAALQVQVSGWALSASAQYPDCVNRGPASRDEGKTRQGLSLLQNIRRTDPRWGVVEFHPATIAFPDRLPSHAESYASIARVLNAGARFISPMWGSHAADRLFLESGFRVYDVFTGTDFEYQFVCWLKARQSIPAGGVLFPIGNEAVSSLDDWRPATGTLTPAPGPTLSGLDLRWCARQGDTRVRAVVDEIALIFPHAGSSR